MEGEVCVVCAQRRMEETREGWKDGRTEGFGKIWKDLERFGKIWKDSEGCKDVRIRKDGMMEGWKDWEGWKDGRIEG